MPPGVWKERLAGGEPPVAPALVKLIVTILLWGCHTADKFKVPLTGVWNWATNPAGKTLPVPSLQPPNENPARCIVAELRNV